MVSNFISVSIWTTVSSLCPASVEICALFVFILSRWFFRVFSTCVLLCCDFRLQFPPHKHTKDTLVRKDAWVFSFLVTVHRKIKQTYGEKKRVLTQDWVVHLFSLNLKWALLVELSGSDDCCSVIHFKECPFFYFCPFWQAGNKKKKVPLSDFVFCDVSSEAALKYKI